MKKKTPNSLPADMAVKVDNAAHTYTRRRDRLEHPDGRFDNACRWYPDDSEGLDCHQYRPPSRAFPYSYMQACRTLGHCARLKGVPPEYLPALRLAVRGLDLAKETAAKNLNPTPNP